MNRLNTELYSNNLGTVIPYTSQLEYEKKIVDYKSSNRLPNYSWTFGGGEGKIRLK